MSAERATEGATVAVRAARSRLDMLRLAAIPIVQTGLGAGLAWFAAREVLGHRAPFFAPIAATIALGLAPGRATRRAIELVVGVAVGIAIGDLLVSRIGTGGLQIALVVMLAMAAAVLVGGGPILVIQSGSSAILIATLARPTDGLVPTRMIDALVGGGVGLLILAVLPRNPVRVVQRVVEPMLEELAATLDAVADALAARDEAAGLAALDRARALDEGYVGVRDAVDTARDTTRLAPMFWRVREHIDRYEDAALQLDRAVKNVRVLARGATRAIDLKPTLPPAAVASVRELADAVRLIPAPLREEGQSDNAIAAVLVAAGHATATLRVDDGLSVSVIVGQVRSTAVDLLRALGVPREDAIRLVRRAAAL